MASEALSSAMSVGAGVVGGSVDTDGEFVGRSVDLTGVSSTGVSSTGVSSGSGVVGSSVNTDGVFVGTSVDLTGVSFCSGVVWDDS